MIEATCITCGKLLGSFASLAEYVQWREKNTECACGASLAAALFTSYTRQEKTEAKSGEEQPQEETKEEKKPTGFPGDILRGRRK